MDERYQLLYHPNSPFSHKVLIAARELGIREKVEVTTIETVPFQESVDPILGEVNPLGKIPSLVVNPESPERRSYVADSAVIVQYLDSMGALEKRVVPAGDDFKRYEILTIEAIADGITDALILLRYESLRDLSKQSIEWKRGQLLKVRAGIIQLAAISLPGKDFEGTLPVSSIAVFSMLWYVERRFLDLGWREWEGVRETGLAEWFENMKKRSSVEAEEVPIF